MNTILAAVEWTDVMMKLIDSAACVAVIYLLFKVGTR